MFLTKFKCFSKKVLNRNIYLKRKIKIKKKKKTLNTLKKMIHCCAFLFQSKSKNWKILCWSRSIFLFVFWTRSGQKTNLRERSEHQKTRFRAWEMIIGENKQKKNFRFFAIAWAEPRFSVRLSVCPSVDKITDEGSIGPKIWLHIRNPLVKTTKRTRAFFEIRKFSISPNWYAFRKNFGIMAKYFSWAIRGRRKRFCENFSSFGQCFPKMVHFKN